jgi:tellurite resistance protein
MVGGGDVGAVQTTAPALFLLANTVVGIIAARTAYLLIRGKIIPSAPQVQIDIPL